MPRTTLLEGIVSLASDVARTEGTRIGRRGFLSAALAAHALAAPQWLKGAAPRVAVIGAGLAGLSCAYRLKQGGVEADVYEASGRAGGRCWSLRGHFDEGQTVERGGELIDQGHTQIRQLAQELRLDLVNVLQSEKNGSEPFYYFDGAPYSVNAARADLHSIWKKLHADVSAASYPTTYYQSTQRGRELDAMSIADWINESVPGGMSSKLGQLLAVAYNIEYGAEVEDQSALNLLYLLGYIGPGQLRLFGPSNEKYRVRGGNDQIVSGMLDALGPRVRTGHRLKALARTAAGGWRVTLETSGGETEVEADHVVLALPFSILRSAVDLSGAGFSTLKMTAINELGMGRNAKFHLQFKKRHWESLGGNGDSYADTGYQLTWEATRGQAGKSGILVNYTGGDRAGLANSVSAAMVLNTLEPVMPGITDQWNGKEQLEYWPGNPYTLGAYSYWRVGQYTRFAGKEGEREGTCHFCGEHTSLDFQGYLNGAVETGERAAGEIISDLKG